MKRPVRIANASGFLGDRDSALAEMVLGGDVDFVTGDYLAELTMMILGKQRLRDSQAGYAAPFLKQIEPVLGTILERGIRVVVNAGGLNPSGLASALRTLAQKQGLEPRIATVEGDDLLGRIPELRESLRSTETGEALPAGPGSVFTANAYLGGFGIARALEAGAQIVLCGRVADASLLLGAAAHWHGWSPSHLDELAGAVVAGHVIECGAQATGGNYSGFRSLDILRPGFPIADVAHDGTSVITKHPGTGGAVTPGTVTAQLVYEIGGPRYLNPDVTVLLEGVSVREIGADRVEITGARGAPPPPTTKVAITVAEGFASELTFVLTGLDVDAKAEALERSARATLADLPLSLEFQRIGAPSASAVKQDEASCFLRVVARSADENAAGRSFSGRLVALALSNYPGLFPTGLPGPAVAVGRFFPALVAQDTLEHRAVLPDGTVVRIAAPPVTGAPPADPAPAPPGAVPGGARQMAPLGAVIQARAGDKGSDANVGVWVDSDPAYAWLREELTVSRLRELCVEAADLPVERYELPGLRALNFVIRGILRGGAAATSRFDRQGKALGEFLRSRTVSIPESLLIGKGEARPAEIPSPELVHMVVEGGVATLTLDSPSNRNALSPALLEQLSQRIQTTARDPALRAVVLTGKGSIFCSGADVSSMHSPEAIRGFTSRNAALLADMLDHPLPIIVLLNGAVRAGGLGLLGTADMVISPRSATFAFSEVRIGAVPATIAAALLPRLDPRAMQRYMLTGEKFDAEEAERIGLVTMAVQEDGLQAALAELLAALRLSSPEAVRSTKELLRQLRTLPLRQGLARAVDVSAAAFGSEDAREGITAFLERRSPRWAT